LSTSRTTGLTDINIHVEEAYRGKGFSRQLLRDLTYYVKDPPKVVYIDTDASSGFWDKVGFRPNPRVDDVNVPEYGYEKCVCWGDLAAFGLDDLARRTRH
jgi:GNAT superfamily N-acetyltransferase